MTVKDFDSYPNSNQTHQFIRSNGGTNQKWKIVGNKIVSQWVIALFGHSCCILYMNGNFKLSLQQNGGNMALAVNPANMQLIVEELSELAAPNQEWEIEELFHSKKGSYRSQMEESELLNKKTFALQNTGNGIMASLGRGELQIAAHLSAPISKKYSQRCARFF